MNGDPNLYKILEILEIEYEYIEHPPVPTIEKAMIYWKDLDAGHCKNLFFRNHKGNRHYLVIIEHTNNLAIKELEQKLKQGKLTFASEKRLKKHLGLTPGSVTPFGLINDSEKHVHIFLDENLNKFQRISFHPNINTASIVILFDDFIKFLNQTGNSYEYVKLY
ncbi:MAG: prolyl-tRNA synthetase associated domain-containing protein [Bacteroidales bacterium]|nr:prolyl-tRNA synthetase associated domain-containing protein [Bacteroidales bacterium]